jgi:hypothetical protein
MNNNSNWDQVSFEISQYYKEVINKILPLAKPASSMVFGSPDEKPITFTSKLSSNESLFTNSPYEYSGENDYLHFTSLQSLTSILNQGFFRMSEFGNLSDNHELIFGGKVFSEDGDFKFKENSFNHYKENIFCLSMSQYSEDTLLNPFMWEAYSQKTLGASIRFKINKPRPYGFALGKVLYGEEKLESLKKLKEIAVEYRKKGLMFPDNFAESITELYAFHKAKKFEIENEVRIIFRKDKDPYEKHKYFTIYRDVTSNNNIKYFNQIFLKGRHETLKELEKKGDYSNDVLEYFPQIEITDIYLGSGINVYVKLDIYDLLQEFKEKHKYEFKIHHLHIDNQIQTFN